MDKPPASARFEMRLPGALAGRVDDWRQSRRPIPNRAAAARALMEVGLDAMAEIARLRALLAAAGVDPDAPKGDAT